MVYNRKRRGETRVRVVGRNNITSSHNLDRDSFSESVWV